MTVHKKKKMELKLVKAATRDRLSKIIEQFRLSKDDVYEFESNLTKHERGAVHNLCHELGLKSISYGLGSDRRVRISKTEQLKSITVPAIQRMTKKEPVKVKEKLVSFTFSKESKADLHDLFSRHPPNDEDMNENKIGESSGKNLKAGGHRDDIFRKPVMTRSEIANKVKSFSSRINRSPSLRKITETRSKLPIASFKDVITSTIESHQVLLICGETGCGKTTQVPQFLLDHSWSKGETCKVVCSQPRRISATSVAERIASERGETLGESVGYKIRMEGKGGRHSSLVFCTNGVLLRVLIGDTTGISKLTSKRTANSDFDITHIIVDEIHERDSFSDVTLTILRDTLPLYPHLRLILMSATIDAEQFSMYFGGCPIIRVPGFTYPVKSFYLENVLSLITSEKDVPTTTTKNSDVTVKDTFLTDGCPTALDEAIDLALSNDDFDPLLELISSEGTEEIFNYQHSKTGETPLMVFAVKGRVSDICMLLSLGVDCHLQSHAGKTAFDYAKKFNQIEAANIIKQRMGKASSMKSNEDKKLLDEDKKLLDEDKKLLVEDNKLLDEHTKLLEDTKLLDEYLLNVNPEQIDFLLIEKLLRRICMDSEDGAILVFLPGWSEISETRDKLLASPFFEDPSKFVVVPLHSKLPSVEQNYAFIRPKRGCRKIILSTNIAETSITIEDVVFVVDTGRMKEKNYDPHYNISTLESSWISKANAKQREGRAGRCQPGICYHLFSKLRWASLPNFQVPEIKRMAIDDICLQVKLIDPTCKIEEFMQRMLDPPASEAINNAVVVLQNAGALTPDEKLTELGEKLGTLPVHPLTSKMLFLAILMNCLDPALTLACSSGNRSPFIEPIMHEEKQRAQAARLELASLYGGNGDQLAVIAAFDCWRKAQETGKASMFCTRYFVSPNGMRMLSFMRKKLETELQRYGFLPEDKSRCSLNAQNPGILHAVIFAGLYPKVGRMIPFGSRSFVQTANLKSVRLHPSSTNAKLSFKKFEVPPLIIFDEVIRGDWGMSIRECCAIGLLPLLLLAAEIVVVPACENDNDKSDYENGDDSEKIMASSENVVKVVVDRWLPLESTALDVAQIYCLRERLAATVLFKVKHPRKILPEHLADSLYAISCILSNDGMSGITLPNDKKPVESVTKVVSVTDIGQADHGKAIATTQLPQNDLNSQMQSQNKSLESQTQPPVSEINVNESATTQKSSQKHGPVDLPATGVSASDIGQAYHGITFAITQLPNQNDLYSLMHSQIYSIESQSQPPVPEIKRRRLGPVDSPATTVGASKHVDSFATIVDACKPVDSLATTVIATEPVDSLATPVSSTEPIDSLATEHVDSLTTIVSASDIGQADHGKAISTTQLPPQNDLNSLMHSQNNSLESSQAQPPVPEINVNKSATKQKSSKKRRRLEPVDSPATMSSASDIGQADHGKAVTISHLPLQNDLNSLLESQVQPPVPEINVNKSSTKQKSSKKRRRLEPVDSPATTVEASKPVDSLPTSVSATRTC